MIKKILGVGAGQGGAPKRVGVRKANNPDITRVSSILLGWARKDEGKKVAQSARPWSKLIKFKPFKPRNFVEKKVKKKSTNPKTIGSHC